MVARGLGCIPVLEIRERTSRGQTTRWVVLSTKIQGEQDRRGDDRHQRVADGQQSEEDREDGDDGEGRDNN